MKLQKAPIVVESPQWERLCVGGLATESGTERLRELPNSFPPIIFQTVHLPHDNRTTNRY